MVSRGWQRGPWWLALVAFGVTAVAGCEAKRPPPTPDREGVGTLQMALAATANGHTYRLRQASFAVTGPNAVVLDSEAQPDAPALTATLAVGSYVILLAGGWFLERLDAGGAVRVEATLLSPNPTSFDITAGASTNVPYLFATDGATVVIGTGTVSVSVEVTETGGRRLSLVAGQLGGSGSGDGVGATARFLSPAALARDDAGHLYIADSLNGTIRRLTLATGEVTTLAGTPGLQGTQDGVGPNARFEDPVSLAWDSGNLYVADESAAIIRKVVVATGEVTTFAGTPHSMGYNDGAGEAARFIDPLGIAADGHGSLFVSDAPTTIRRIDIATAEVTTLAGAPGLGGSEDGVGGDARFNQPRGLAADGAGNLYVTDTFNESIRKIVVATGEVTTLAGGLGFELRDGIGRGAQFSLPWDVSLDGAGNLYVADANNNAIRRIDLATAEVTTFVAAEAPAAPLPFRLPQGVLADGAGHVYVADTLNDLIRRIDLAPATVATIAGAIAPATTADGTRTAARFIGSTGMASDGQGNLYVTQFNDNTIRKVVLATGEVTTLAGTAGTFGYVDGTGAAARFNTPWGLTSDGQGSLYVADSNNVVVRRIAVATGEVTTVAGTPNLSGDQDGVGVGVAQFANPFALVADGQGNLYVVDMGNRAIRRVVIATGEITTIAGTRFLSGSIDGTGAAASFEEPTSVALDGAGNLLIGDQRAHTIRKVAIATGEVTTLAGQPGVSGSSDGTGAAAQFAFPNSLAGDGAGNVFIADAGLPSLRKIVSATGAVTTVLGSPPFSGVVPGPLPARLNRPSAVAVLPDGRVAVADEGAVLVARF